MKRIQKVYIIADRKVNNIGYCFRAGICVCYNRKPIRSIFGNKIGSSDKIIEADLIIPVQGKWAEKKET